MRGHEGWARLALLGLLLVPAAALAQVKTNEGGDGTPAAAPPPVADSTALGSESFGASVGLTSLMSQSGSFMLYGRMGSSFAYAELSPGVISVRRPPGAGATESEGLALPTVFAIGRGFPNPFEGRMTVSFELPATSRVRLEVLDIQGRHVTSLADGELAPGRYSRAWEGRDANGRTLPSGMYFLRMDARSLNGAGGLQKVEKMLLLR